MQEGGAGNVGRFYLDNDEKKIVKAVIHSDEKRQKRQQAGKKTPFDTKVTAAIEKAKKDLDLGEVTEEVREIIIQKIYKSLLYNTPWELSGETYCCRSLFYEYRKQFCYLVAQNLGIIRQQAGKKATPGSRRRKG